MAGAARYMGALGEGPGHPLLPVWAGVGPGGTEPRLRGREVPQSGPQPQLWDFSTSARTQTPRLGAPGGRDTDSTQRAPQAPADTAAGGGLQGRPKRPPQSVSGSPGAPPGPPVLQSLTPGSRPHPRGLAVPETNEAPPTLTQGLPAEGGGRGGQEALHKTLPCLVSM